MKKAPGEYSISKKSAAEIIGSPSNNNQRGKNKLKTKKSQELQSIETHKLNASSPNQLKQNQLSILRKSYTQVVKRNLTQLSSEKL